MESDAEISLRLDQKSQSIDLLTLAEMCKNEIFVYFHQLREFCQELSSEGITHETFVHRLNDLSKEILTRLPVYILDDELIENKHHRISTDEDFAIGLANFCFKKHFDIISKIKKLDIRRFKEYIELLLNSFFERLFNPNSPPEQKILIRSWLIKDLSRTKGFQLNAMISGIDKYPPYRLSRKELGLFDAIRSSNVIKESIELFIQDTLEKGSAPFQDAEEGRRLIYDTFAWAIASPNVLFAGLLTTAHGFSSDSYLFINSRYAFCDDLNEAMRLLTLLHECFHIYKRLWNSNLINSPINTFIIQTQHRGEDGRRFMEFLLPNKGTVLYDEAASYLCEPENWNSSLSQFQTKFNESQQDGGTYNSPSLIFSENLGCGQWPICFRDPTLVWLRPKAN